MAFIFTVALIAIFEMNHEQFDELILGPGDAQSNTSIPLKQPFQSRNIPQQAQRFLEYLRTEIILRWRDRDDGGNPRLTNLITARIPVDLFGEDNCAGINGAIPQVPARPGRFKIKRFSFESDAWNEPNNNGQKLRAFYVAGRTKYLFVKPGMRINSLDSLRTLITRLRTPGTSKEEQNQYLGLSVCSKGNVERVEVPGYARRCGIGSSLLALCFNDAETKREGGEDLFNNAIWNRITDSQTNPDFSNYSIDMMARMQVECQTITYLTALLPDNLGEMQQKNKAFVYGALAANYQKLVVWGPLLRFSETHCRNPAHVHLSQSLDLTWDTWNPRCDCINMPISVGTEELISSFHPPHADPIWIVDPLPTTLVDFATEYGVAWFFCLKLQN